MPPLFAFASPSYLVLRRHGLKVFGIHAPWKSKPSLLSPSFAPFSTSTNNNSSTTDYTGSNARINMNNKLNVNVEGMRESYSKTEGISESEVSRDPFEQFREWFTKACERSKYIPGWEANAMCLSTVSSTTMRPSSRMVLLKAVDEGAFIWYTNYNSGKATDLAGNPYACLNFYWYPLERSVRIEGIVEKVPEATSDAYFKSRPKESQIGAIISHQSQPIESADALRHQYDALLASEQQLHRPKHWGGYRLIPDKFEFWKGRAARLHDRIVYELDEENKRWNTKRLQP